MADKSEKATPKKLRDARKKGQVAKAQDLCSALTFIVSIVLLLVMAGYIFNELSRFLLSMFQASPHVNLPVQIGALLRNAFTVIIKSSLPVLGLVALVGILVNFLLVGPMFSTEVLKPDLKKLNPVENIKQKFKLKTLVELLKSLFKIFGAAFLIYLAMQDAIREIVQTAGLTLASSVIVFKTFLIRIVVRVGIFFLAIALFDLIYQKRVFAKEMMMEKFEVKQEYKDTEGSPEIKGRRRQLAQEIAYEEAGPNIVRRAKAVITNPTHLAVAIGYEPEKYPAPFILTMGMGAIAEAMIEMAIRYNVAIMRNVPLARQLFETGKVMEYIPKETYEAVAEILRWILALEEGESE